MASASHRIIRTIVCWLVFTSLLAAGGWYVIGMPGSSWTGSLPPLDDAERQLAQNLRRHVEALAGRIGERHLWRPPALASAAEYIREVFERAGFVVREQPFVSRGQSVSNLEIELPGGSLPQEIVVVGAHYDSVKGTAGANDNASGVAALLEIASLLSSSRSARTVRLVAFVNEEQPFFYGEDMGSYVYATRSKERGEQIEGMLALETIGYYTDKPGSQRYPFPFSLFYPAKGNFLGFVGNLSSRSLVRRAVGSFRSATRFPSEGVAAPGWMTGVHWSDHWSFWQVGYPAIMVTDTALFRYPHYHAPSDTPDKLDYESLARVTRGLAKVILELASG
jgi:hypothetical protein